MSFRFSARGLGPVAVLVAVLAIAGVAVAQGWTADSPHHAGLHTGTLLFPAPGVMITSLGVEYLPDVTNDLAGVEGEILRAPTLGLALGLSDQATFQLSWPAYNRLRVHEQRDPPPLGRRLGPVSRDWGDLTVATLIRLHADHGRWPGAGIRFAAKLPNSNEKLGIGNNTTDVFASALLSRSFARRVSVFADLGLGILTRPATVFAQDDVFSYALMADWQGRERLNVVGEVAGYAAHTTGPETGSRSELRAGLESSHRAIHWSALAVRRLSGWDARGVGVAFNVSTSFNVLGRATRTH